MSLNNALSDLLECYDETPVDDAIREVCRAIVAEGMECEIQEDDDGPDDMGDDGDALWVVSTHRLIVGGERVAEWTRCSMGAYGEVGRQCSDDDWCVTEDTNGDDKLPDGVAVALDSLGLEDGIPDVPAPPKADEQHDEDEDGEYAVYWETVGDDTHVVARYTTEEAAVAVCEQRNREFSARHPSGGGTTYLCGYGVRVLDGDEWVRYDTDR